MKKKRLNLRKLWFSLFLLVGITASASPGIQQVTEATNVAEINGTGYETLQAAVDAAYADMTGDITITITSDFTGNTVVRQKAGLNLTISGGNSSAKKTIIGQIMIDGDGRAAGTETLTLKYISFTGNKDNFAMPDAFVLIPSVISLPDPYTRNGYNYAHNITLSNCVFNSTSNSMDVVGIKVNSNAGAYNLTLKSVTGNSLHSFAQLTGTTGATFSSCKATETGSFINVSGGTGDYTISGCTFPTSKEGGYAIRIKDGSSSNVILEGSNNLNATDVVINKATGGASVAIKNGSYTGNISGSGTISISGGSFYNCGDISSYYAEGFNPTTCTINGEEVLTGKNVLFKNVSGVESLKDFSSTVISASGTYKLLQDVTSTARLAPGILASNITLDLNGHTLTSTATDYAVLLGRAGSATASKTFEIIDTSEGKGGKLIVNSAANAAFQVQGKYNELTIGEGVTIEGGCVALLSENDKLTVEGTINSGNDFAIATNGSSTKDATIDIKNGAVLNSTSVAVYLPGTGTTTIEEGSSITGTTGVYIKSGILNITGGEITGNGAKAEFTHNGNGVNSTGNALVVENCGYPGGDPVVNITGGTFISTNNTAIASYAYGEGREPVAHFVSGGKFSSELDESICAVGMGTAGTANSEGFYELVEYVAKIGETSYESLTTALAVAQSGETITLLKDISEAGTVALPAGVTLEGNGKTISGNSAIKINKEGGTVSNVAFANIHNSNNNLTAIYATGLTGTATITGCSFDNCDWDAIQATPASGASVIITDNQFSDDDKDGITQQRYVHIQSVENVDFSATVTGNVMLGKLAQEPLGVYYPIDPTKVDLTKNYIESIDDVCILIADKNGYAGELVFPAYTTATKEETATPVAYVQNGNYAAKFYDTFTEAVTAANGNVITLVAKVSEPYTLSDGETLKVKKNGKTITVKAPDEKVVSTTTTDGITTYTLNDASVMYIAANGNVTYSAAIPSALSTGTYKLLADITRSLRITPGVLASNITLDLNGHTLTSTATDYAILLGRAGSATASKTFEIIDTSEGKGGKLIVNSAANAAFQVQGKYNELTIGEGVTIEGGCVALLSENDKLTVEGTINSGNDFAIATNGSSTKDATIDIKNGAVLNSTSVAVYLPGTGTTTIEEGSSITGTTGVYIKSGILNITGGEITGNGAKAEFTHNGNGVNSTGNALVVENCGYPGGDPVVNITGGTFISTNNTAIASYAYGEGREPVAHFVSGGKFSSELDESICAVGMGTAGTANSEGFYELVEYVAKVGTLKFETLKEAFEAATDGASITLLKDETLSERIACTLTSGSFTIAFGDYTLSKGVYSVTILPGVTIYTDKETDIFTTSEGAIQKVANGDSGFIYSVDPNGIVTSINGRILDEQVEGIYSTNGMKQDRLMPGMNIIRYANGKTKTVLVK